MSDIWNEEDDKTLDELLEIFEKEDNQETKTEEEQKSETTQEQEENTKEENTNETEQQSDNSQPNNTEVDNSKDIELEKLRKELERMKAENERIKAIEEENARIKMIAEEKGVDISRSVYDITEDDIKALEEDYPDQARIMRGLYRQLQNNAKSDNNVSQKEDTPTVEQQPTQQDNVRVVIDKYTPELALWLDHQDKYGNEWQTACSIDTKLQNSPEWANRPIGERFQEVLRLTKEQLFNTERTKANETVSRTELQSPTSPSQMGGSTVNNSDNFARISNMSDEDFLTGNLSARDIQEIYKQCF